MSQPDEYREKHKKEQRLQNSLGSLLLGIGKGKISVNSTPVSSNSAASNPKVTNGSDQHNTASTSGSRTSSYGTQKPKEADSWQDLKYYDDDDDDLDPMWLEEEHERLDQRYGKGIVTVKYTEQNVLGYYCELCFATMNAMKSLEMHCNGMKHLKKKDIYEKKKASGDIPIMVRRKNTELSKYPESEPAPYPGSERNPYSKESRNSRDERSAYPVDDYTRHPKSDWGSTDRYSPYSQDERDHLARDIKDPYARESRDPYVREDPYARQVKDPYVREVKDPYVREDRDLYSRKDRDRHSRDDLDRRERHGSPSRSSSYADHYRAGDRRLSAERSYGSNISHGIMEKRDSHTNVPLRVPTPPPATLPPPAKRPALELPTGKSTLGVDASLAGGPAAALLMKLSQCSIKNENDAELASSVINLLLSSLKGYHHSLGEKNVADLMEQAEIKLGTAKAIRTIKKVTPSPQIDAVSIALETLRRVNSDVPAFASLI